MGYNVTPHIYKAEDYGVPQKRHRLILAGISSRFEEEFNVPYPIITDGDYVTARQAIEEPPIPDNAANHERRGLTESEQAQLKDKTLQFKNCYIKFDPDQPAYTITALGGGGSYGYHWKDERPFTNRERARFQSFNDGFVFMGSRQSVRRQIGMAVPPLLSRHIFTAILKTLHHIPYTWVAANENWRLCGQMEFDF